VNLAFFSGNEVYWKTRWEASTADGGSTDYRTQVVYKEGSSAPSGSSEHRNCYNNYDCDPSDIWTGLWREATGSTPENSLSGQISWRLNQDRITVPGEYAGLRFWRNTAVAGLSPTGQVSLAYGTLGYEWNPEYPQYADFYPAGRVLLSTTTATSFTNVPEQHHLSLYRAPSGALVFGAGTVQWSWGLDAKHDRQASTEDPNVQQATVNLFADMGVQPATLQSNLVAAIASTDTTPPTITVTSPESGASVPGGAITITGTASDTDGVVGVVEISTDGGTVWRRATGRESWSHTYTAAEGPAEIRVRAADDSANLSAPVTHTFTVEPRICPCSIWMTTTPGGDFVNDTPVELGVRFRSDVDGYITGIRFWKPSQATGTHVGHLWNASGGTPLGEVIFTGETASGWQEATFGSPIPITANTTYIASYHAPAGYAATTNFFATGLDNPPLYALANGVDGSNGVYKYGPSGSFPTDTFQTSNYWVDVVFATTADDTTPPIVTQLMPADGAYNVNTAANIMVTFSESVDPNTITSSTFELRDGESNLVPAAVSYAASTRTATLDPNAALDYNTAYTARLKGGPGGIADLAGNVLADDYTWTFTTSAPPPPPPDEGPGGPILVVSSGDNPFGRYLVEILRAEGLNAFSATGISSVSAEILGGYQVVLLGEMALTDSEVAMLSGWVESGGNLVAMRPDKKLAGMLGLVDASGTLSNAYLQFDTAAGAGRGLVEETIQFHGSADHYTLEGAQALAMLYSSATAATSYPAVTINTHGSGKAAAFTYDLARSVVYTRQGNPAWAGQERDNFPPMRANDMFFGGTETDWIDLNKVAIPQADEQQRLLAKLIVQMNLDQMPLPRFWYFPRGEKALVVMTHDEHGGGNITSRLDYYNQLSPAGCSVDDWECIRSTVYMYTNAPIIDSQVAAYQAQGHEFVVHIDTGCANFTYDSLAAAYASQIPAFLTKFPSVATPMSTQRTHCIAWSDWDSQPRVQLQNNMRLDTNYYYWPQQWIQDRPGMFTGSGMPMRFASQDGTLIDVYQAATQMTDESGQTYPKNIDALLDNALGPNGYYGAFTTNIHTDGGSNATQNAQAIVQSARSRGVPVISAIQLLTWLDGRNSSKFNDISWTGDTLSFSVTPGAGANGLYAMLPFQSKTGTLQSIALGSNPVAFTTETIKGLQYAVFPANPGGDFTVVYAMDSSEPVISNVASTNNTDGTTTITWTTDEASDSRVDYGTTSGSLDKNASSAALVTQHSITLSGLTPGTTYYFTVTSKDAAANSTTSNELSFVAEGLTCSPCTIFGTTPGGSQTADTSALELGVKFQSSVDGWITGVRFFKPAGSTGAYTGRLWNAGGTLLASAAFVVSESGWQEVLFPAPVAITANTTYIASYSWPGGHYPYQADAFKDGGITTGPLTALQHSAGSPNGVYNTTPGSFPMTGIGANYFADVIFETTQPGDTTAPVISNVTAAPAADGTATITWTTDEASDSRVDYGTTSGTLGQSASSASLVSTHSINLTGLTPGTTYYFTVTSKDAADNSTTSMESSFTVPIVSCPCSIWAPTTTPGNPAVTDNQPIEVGVKFRSDLDGWITGLRFYKGTLNTGINIGHLWSLDGTQLAEATFENETASGWQQVTLTTPVQITAGTTYIASYHSSSGYFAIDASYFTEAGVDNPPLHALQAGGINGPNGVYKYGASGFPANGNSANYWVDVVFETTLPVDETPPQISDVTAAPASDGTALITWTTDEASDSLVEYGTVTGTLISNKSSAALVTSHSISLTGLASGTTYYYSVTSKDAANNSASSTELSFTTPAEGLADTTVADFSAGTLNSCEIDSGIGDGALRLGSGLSEEFSGEALPAGWNVHIWNTGSQTVVNGGLLTVDGSQLYTSAQYGPGRTLEFMATFGAQPFQHIGFGGATPPYNESPWIMFSTGDDAAQLYARVLPAGSSVYNTGNDKIPLGNYLGSPHTYRIDWKTNSIDFYVDDILNTTVTATIPDSMNVAVSDNWSAAPSLTVDWLRMDPPYASPCTFESRILDAGVIVDWQELISVKSTPAGTTVAFQTRSGTVATPDETWSEWEAVGATIASPNGRYIQYQATLTSTDPAQTPVIESVTLTHVPVSNTAPAAQGDTYTVDEDTTLNIAAPGVLDNDTDADGDPLTAIKATDPVHGDLTFNGDGSFTYTPVAGFSGSDSFTYKANDGAADSNVATVNITVNAVNDAPTDISLSVQTVAENAPVDTVVGTLSSTDPDAGDTFTYTLVNGAGDTDNASFYISGDSLRTSEIFDYETKNSYSLRVRTTDQGGLFFEKQFAITITDAVEAFSLTVSKTGSGSGTVTSDPAGIDCGEDCSESYNQGTLVTLTAIANPGSTFTGWSGAGCSGTGSCNITVDAVKSVSANFDLIEYTLDVTTEGSGTVTKDPNKDTYAYGEEVTLTATPDLGWSFSGWSGDATGSTDTVTITITGNTTVTATFTQNQYTLTTNVVGSGTVTKAPDKATYAYGEEVTLTATPDLGWSFSGWSGDATGSTDTVTITITGNTTVTATFTQNQYTLTTNVVGSGTVTKVPDKATYAYGEEVTLTATPDLGWSFSGWSGDATGSTDTVTITITGNTTVTATFTQNQYTLTTNVVGSGTVTKAPDKATYAYGEEVTLTATPDLGWSFSGWSGDATGSTDTVTITITGNTTVTATFTQNQYTLTTNVVGSGTVTKVPDKATYAYGEEVTLTATPDLGWSFSGWSGDATGSTDTVTITITGNTTVTATFTQNQYTLTTNVVGSGTVTKVPDKATYAYGEEVTLTATPDLGWSFSGWSGDATGSTDTVTITITGNTTVTATFTEIPPAEYTLTVTIVGNGTVTKSPDKAIYMAGEEVTFTATPASGWTFSSWSGGATGSTNPVIITLTGNTIVTATFVDTTAPQSPENLTAVLTSVSIVLDWADNTEPDLAGYKVYRRAGSDGEFTLLTPTLLTASYFEDQSAPTGVTSYYRVTAVDTSANESDPAEVDRTRTIAFRAASSSANHNASNLVIPRPAGLQNGDFLLAIITFNGSPTVTAPTGWTLVRTDQTGTAVRQAVYYRFAGLGEPASYAWTFSSRVGASGGIVAYSGVHVDAPLDSSSGQANPSAMTYTAPQVVTSSSDSFLVAAFGVATNASVAPPAGMIEQVEATMTVGKDKLTTEVADQIQAQAGASGVRTASGDKAAQSIGQLLAIRPSTGELDKEPPTKPTDLTAQAVSPYRVDLSWSPSTDNVGVTGYTIYRNGTELASVTQTSYSDTTVEPETSYTYTVVAYDSAGNRSAASAPADITTPAEPLDTVPPTTPENLTAKPVSPYQVDLSWSPSTDNVGVAGYTIYRDGAEIASVTQTAYSDTSVLPEKTYTYTIVAYDSAGNRSAASAPAEVTTPALPPPPPAGIQFVAAAAAANPNNSANLVINRPNGAAAGHFLLASIDVRSGVTVDPPDGWTQLLSTKSGNSLEKITYYRFVTEGEPASYVWSFNGAAAASGVILAYSGVDVTNPIDAVAGQANASSTTLTAPSITSETANTMLVALYGIATNASIEPPASMTERAEVIGSAGKDKVSSEAADQTLAVAGATGDRMARAAKAGDSVGQLIALRPAQ
jgi:uncharacterized repeat protein (TIGR02543 family)